MQKPSAGILLYRVKNKKPEFFLVHPGGPFWKNKDTGAWSIPKGEFDDSEDALAAAKREFEEETGVEPKGKFISLTSVKQKSGKIVFAWALAGDLDENNIQSNTFTIEWPPKSGRSATFPEIDRAAWFGLDAAKEKIIPAQVAFINELMALLKKVDS